MTTDEVTPVSLSAPGGELFVAMMYLAVVAYPESHAKRDRFILAMKAHCMRYARRHHRMERERAAVIVGAITRQQQHGKIHQGMRRLAHRLRMAEVALPSFLEILSSPRMRIEVRGSLTARIGDLPADRRESFRQWKATLPVLHLALALRTVLSEPRELGVALLHHSDWVGRALGFAEHILPFLRKSQFLKDVSMVRLLQPPANH